ncbi:L,D-transpeptidase family protein [Microbacterium sp. cf332]|uniref:L,D-transpeptidase family protein n=1 Tax=Microbacterium sp. cf332 TaxID=1761804 RepID=UPI00088C82D5|nr:L,D-transpeptidase family protein [Microbacterium sp. cf332]SDQ77044.1 Lipoprotein-anchoring transpeptidase ErfK/SrfK [Microbacterium sp. cf332]
MTDVASKHDHDSTTGHDLTSTDVEQRVEWAPAEPARKKRRLGLWIGIPVGVVVAGAAAASFFLIAPGTTIGGVPVGFLTPGAAAAAVQDRLEVTTVTLGDGGQSVSGEDLGAQVDATALAASAFDARPAWNVTQWFGDPIAAPVSLDAETATTALRDAAGDLYVEPTPASVTFDGASYTVSPDVAGAGVDPEAARAGLQGAFDAGDTAAVIDPQLTPVSSLTTTASAEETAASLNAMLDGVGFYVGDERTVPVDRDVAASWITVGTAADGSFEVTADPAAIQPIVDTLPGLIDRAPVDGVVFANASGTVIDDSDAALDGRTLQSTDGIAAGFAEQLATGDAAYRLPVDVVPVATQTITRLLEVDLGEQRLYLKENGAVVDSWLVSTGRPGADTQTGHYTIGWKTPLQDMKGTAADSGKSYVQPDVKWAMYFNGDQAFHGVYWHSNWGNQMSAGCVGMPDSRAAQIYDWAVAGTDVWVHS